jgi:hypothetical protein
MNVNAMQRTTSSPLASSAATSRSTPSALILLALKAGAAAALVAAVLAGHVSDRAIIVGVILVASLIGWHHTQWVPARARSQHRFTVVSRCGDGFVTIDSSGAKHVARRLALDSPPS